MLSIEYGKHNKNNLKLESSDISKFFTNLQYLIDIEENTEENNNFNQIISDEKFKILFKKIFQSKCLNQYYVDYEKLTYKDQNSKTDSDETFKDFMDGIILVPLPIGVNGFTDNTLIIFINNKPRGLRYHHLQQFRKLVIIKFE